MEITTVNKSLLRAALLIVLLGVVATMAFGQAETGQVAGTAQDPSGAVVPNATVTLTNTGTGAARTATTGPNGEYVFTNLQPGTYSVSVTAAGFNAYKQNVQVTVGSRNTVDAKLALTSSGTVVEVTGEGGAIVNTQDQQLSDIVSSQAVSQLPTVTRNPYDLVSTAANVSSGDTSGRGASTVNGFSVSINGQRAASTNILLDGGENVDYFTATVGQQTPLDSVQEFRVVTSDFTAEYGRATGGVVNVATKAGTNSFHGTAYEFNRISDLAANTFDNAANGVPKSRFVRNQFGYSFGGPVIKNKLFFFSSTEFIRVRSNSQFSLLVPDPSFIAAAAPNVRQFFSTFGTLKPNLQPLGTVSAGGAALFDKVGLTVPQEAGGGLPQNSWMTVARVDYNMTDKTQVFARFAYYRELDFPGTVNYSPYVGYDTTNYNQNYNGMLNLTHVFTSSLVSQSKLVIQRLTNLQPLGAAPVGPTLYLLNTGTARISGTRVALPGYSEFTPGNAIPFGGPQNLVQGYQDLSWTKGNHQFRFGGNYIWTNDNRAFGAYEEAVEALSGGTLSTGLSNFLAGNLALFRAAVFPQGKFPCVSDPTTGKAIVIPACTVTLPVGPPSFSRSNLYNDGAAYAQDAWKITPRLTLNLGLRWEYFGVQHNRNPNLDSNFYFGAGNTIQDQVRNGFVATVPNSPIGSLWKPRYHNFGPRVGFALDMFGNGKTSLRGGYGIAYERNFGNVTYNVIQNPPNYAVLSLQPTDVGGRIPVTTDNAGPLAGSTGTKPLPAVSLRQIDQNLKSAYAYMYSLTAEQEIAPNTIFSLGYSGSRGLHQYSISNYNRPGMGPVYLGDPTTEVNQRLNRQYGDMNTRGANGDSYYNALLVGFRSNNLRSAGVSVNANYTYAHTIDNLSTTFSEETQALNLGFLDPFNPRVDKGSADYDVRHQINVSLVWDLPFFRNSQSTLLRHVLGGFQFAPIFHARTGTPFTIYDCTNEVDDTVCARFIPSGAVANSGSTSGHDLGGNLYNYLPVGAPVPYADPLTHAGELPTCTSPGVNCFFPANMSHRNAFVGPSYWNWDLGAYKNFKITERFNLQLRGEFFNVLNHHNFFMQPGSQMDVSTAGGGPFVAQMKKGGYGLPTDERRNTQLAIKIIF
jgi:hypothetical protein